MKATVEMRGRTTAVTLAPGLEIQNLLPVACSFVVVCQKRRSAAVEAEPGAVAEIADVSIPAGDNFELEVTMDPASGWEPGCGRAARVIGCYHQAVAVRHLLAAPTRAKLDLDLEFTKLPRCVIYAPHWLANHTGLPLCFSAATATENKWRHWPHAEGAPPDGQAALTLCNLVGVELRVAVQGTKAKAVDVTPRYAKAWLEHWSAVQLRLFDLSVLVSDAPPPFQRTKVVTFRPQVALTNLLPRDILFHVGASAVLVPGGGRCCIHVHPRAGTGHRVAGSAGAHARPAPMPGARLRHRGHGHRGARRAPAAGDREQEWRQARRRPPAGGHTRASRWPRAQNGVPRISIPIGWL